MYLLTYGDNPSKIKYLKSKYINIGDGKKFKDLFSKFEALKEWIDEAKPDPNELLIFVDGYDVVQKRTDLENFEKEFENFHVDLVISAETFCWPNKWMEHLFPLSPTKYRFPNSGTFAGRVWAIQKMLEWAPYRINYDDQGYVHDFYISCKSVKMALDVRQVLFQTGTFIEWSEIDKTEAYFIHFNGNSHLKSNGESVLEECASGQPIGAFQKRTQIWNEV